MRNFLSFAVLVIIALSAIGCASRNTLEIVNESQYDLTFTQNGKSLEWKFPSSASPSPDEQSTASKDRKMKKFEVRDRLRPGESAVVSVMRDSMFVTKAWNGKEFVGTTTFRKDGVIDQYSDYGYSSGYYNRREYPEAWIIRSHDFGSDSGGNGIFGRNPVIDVRKFFR